MEAGQEGGAGGGREFNHDDSEEKILILIRCLFSLDGLGLTYKKPKPELLLKFRRLICVFDNFRIWTEA